MREADSNEDSEPAGFAIDTARIYRLGSRSGACTFLVNYMSLLSTEICAD